MRTVSLIVAGLAALLAAPGLAQAQFYGYPAYVPYYAYPPPPYPYGYYLPPVVIYAPPRFYRHVPMASRFRTPRAGRHAVLARTHRARHRDLVNPLLGPLPDAARHR